MHSHTNMKNAIHNRGVKDHDDSPAFFAPPAPGENGSRHATLLVFKGRGCTRNRNPIRSRACKSPPEPGSARPPFPCACDGTR